MSFYSTKDVAQLLGIRPDTLQKAVWTGRVDAPSKGPGGAYFWMESDIERASWQLLHRAYKPEGASDEK